MCTLMFIVSPFTMSKTWKQPKCSQTNEWIKKMWYIYTMEYYSAIETNDITLICSNMNGPRHYHIKQRQRKTNTM